MRRSSAFGSRAIRRQEVFRLQEVLDAVDLDAQEVGVHVPNRYVVLCLFVRRLVQMKHAAAFATVVHRADGVFFLALFAVKIHGISRLPYDISSSAEYFSLYG